MSPVLSSVAVSGALEGTADRFALQEGLGTWDCGLLLQILVWVVLQYGHQPVCLTPEGPQAEQQEQRSAHRWEPSHDGLP